jgi:hypothetical protein
VKGDFSEDEAIKRFSDVLQRYGEGLDLKVDDPAICFVPMLSGRYLDGIAGAPNSVLQKCSTVLHVAGTTDWDTPQDELIATNMEPTLTLLSGAKDILPNLKSFVFCSTSFAEGRKNVSCNMPVPEGPLSKVSDHNDYFSNYAKVKAMTEHAIESWISNNYDSTDLRVSILRPGTVAPSIGLDNVPVGWYTDNKSLAAGIKMAGAGIFGKMLIPAIARAGVDTGIIPVDHCANMIVLVGGNGSLKGEEGKPFYLNACCPTNLEAKWETLWKRNGMRVSMDISEREKDLNKMFVTAETEFGYTKSEMRLLRAVSNGLGEFTAISFHDWKFETKNQAFIYDGLHPEYRMTMPVSVLNVNEMNTWVDEIMFKIGGMCSTSTPATRTKARTDAL